MRRTHLLIAVPAAAVLTAATLTACTGTTPAAACEPTPSGAASQSVKIDGALNMKLTLGELAAPLEVETTQRTELIAGQGTPLEDGYTAELFYAIYNGATGELIEDSHDLSEDPIPFVYQAGTSVPGMEATLHCANAGSRVAAVIPPAEGFGDAGVPDVGLEPGQSLILVADIVSVEPTPTEQPSAQPEPTDLPTPAAWTTDVPVVDLTAATPTVTIPDAPAPAGLVLTVLEEGDGAVVANPSDVTVDYLGASWETKTVFDSSYSRGAPATFSTAGVVPGFAAALVGQKVGSTVLVSIPAEFGYPGTPDDADPTSPTGRTLVFLIEIHDAQ